MYTVNFRSDLLCDQERLKTISECHAWIERHFKAVENAPESFAYIQNGRKMYGIEIAGGAGMLLTNIKDRMMTMDQIWDEVAAQRRFRDAMNRKQEERPEIVPAAPVFTAHEITTAAGESFPVAWHQYAGNVIAEITLANGKNAEITIDPESPHFIAALCAAQEAERIAAAEAEAEKERRRAERRAARAAGLDKQAHGPVPEKSFIGTKIQGLGYTIEFSATYERTRIIFDSIPTDAAKTIVKEAGFFYSPALKSWNKGLNWKAYRAALKVQEQLTALKELPCKVKRRAA